MNEGELFGKLAALLPSQLDAVVVRARLGDAYLTRGAPVATRASEILVLAKQSKETWARIEKALEKIDPPPPPPPGDPLFPWLRFLRGIHGHLPLIGPKSWGLTMPIGQVFVPLRLQTTHRKTDIGFSQTNEKEHDVHLRDTQRATIEESLKLALQCDPPRLGLSILGNPGAGKTTLLKHLFCQAFDHGTASLNLPAGLQPVFIRMADLVPYAGTAWGLASALGDCADREGFGSAKLWLNAIRNHPESPPPFLFLLDGLDEVKNESQRKDVCRWLEVEAQRWTHSVFIATCRFAAWKREAKLRDRFLTAEVESLSTLMVQDYVHRWFDVVIRQRESRLTPQQQKEIATKWEQGLLETLMEPKRQAQKRVRDMTHNPLLLSNICLVYLDGHVLPSRRVELYDQTVGLLLHNWASQRSSDSHIDNKAGRQVLQPLAWHMHNSFDDKEDEGDTRNIDTKEAEAIIAEPLQQIAELKHMAPSEFLKLACDECGLLATPDFERYQFFHLGFQEYLAACHVQTDQTTRVPWLVNQLKDSKWEEPFLLAASLPGVFLPLMRELIQQHKLPIYKDKVATCLDEVPRIEAAPFVEVLQKATQPASGWERFKRWWNQQLPDPSQHPPTVTTILELFRSRPTREMVELAEPLQYHSDPGVAAAARAMVGDSLLAKDADVGSSVATPVGPPPNPKPSQRWREPTLEMDFVWVPPAEFWMGSSKVKGEPCFDDEAHEDETPAHRVKLTKGYWMSVHPVTNVLYRRYVTDGQGRASELDNSTRFNHPDQPVVGVDWRDAMGWCRWAKQVMMLPQGWECRLPTEAQWEHAARGTDGRKYPWGKDVPTPERAVFGLDGSTGAPAMIGGRPLGQSPYGVEDMAGNVWEWCFDPWTNRYLTERLPRVDPGEKGHHDDKVRRAVRGGSWISYPRGLRCAYRFSFDPVLRLDYLGFRVLLCGFGQHVDR